MLDRKEIILVTTVVTIYLVTAVLFCNDMYVFNAILNIF